MNISESTIEKLDKAYIYNFYDEYCNVVSKENATRLHIGFEANNEYANYIDKTIKATKKEITFEYIIDKINKDNVYKSFCDNFKKLLPERFKNSIDVYPASYGIGIFVALSFRNEKETIKTEIENTLKKHNVIYSNEYSDAGWVFRYKISKSKDNIDKINSIS